MYVNTQISVGSISSVGILGNVKFFSNIYKELYETHLTMRCDGSSWNSEENIVEGLNFV